MSKPVVFHDKEHYRIFNYGFLTGVMATLAVKEERLLADEEEYSDSDGSLEGWKMAIDKKQTEASVLEVGE